MAPRIICIVIIFGLLACSREPSMPTFTPPPQPQLDFSTPDRALKSYWAQKEWWNEYVRKVSERIHAQLPEYPEVMMQVTTGQLKTYYSKPQFPEEKLQREIISVKQETDSRAVAIANIRYFTEISANLNLTYEQLRERERGTDFKYVLEREGKAWKVAEVWRKWNYTERWEKLYTRDKPFVPTFVITD